MFKKTSNEIKHIALYKYSTIYGISQGKSSLMIFNRHANLKYKYESRNFWCRGYYVYTVGKNKKVIEYMDPFTGSKNK